MYCALYKSNFYLSLATSCFFQNFLCWSIVPFSIELSWHPLLKSFTIYVTFYISWSMNKDLSTYSFPFLIFPHYLFLFFFSHNNCFVVIDFFLILFCLFYLGWLITPSRSLWIKDILQLLPCSLLNPHGVTSDIAFIAEPFQACKFQSPIF